MSSPANGVFVQLDKQSTRAKSMRLIQSMWYGKEIQGYYTKQCFCIQGSTPQNENRKNDIQDNEKSLHTTQD